MDPVIHFEMPANDPDRVRKFYESAFGWQTTPLGPETRDYVLAFTIETDEETRMPKKRGAINGGFYRKTAPDQQVRLTILVEARASAHPCGRSARRRTRRSAFNRRDPTAR